MAEINLIHSLAENPKKELPQTSLDQMSNDSNKDLPDVKPEETIKEEPTE